MLRNSRGTSKD